MLEADADELFLAKRFPDRMKRRILERSFRKLTELADKVLDSVFRVITERAFSQDAGSIIGLYIVTGSYNGAPAAIRRMVAAGQGDGCKR